MFQSPDEDSFAPKVRCYPADADDCDAFQSPDEDSFTPKSR